MTVTLTAPVAPPRPSNLARDVGIVMLRELRPVLHDPFSLIFGMIQPLVFLALFGPLLAGTLGGSGGTAIGGDVWGWFMPAILVMTALFGTSTTGPNLLFELQTGAHERMLVTPLPRSSLLVGRALKEMVPLTGQAVVIVVVMLPFGLRVDALGVLAGLVVLAVFGVGLGSLSYALAVAVRKQEWMFWAVQQTLLFPLMILSGMLLPLETGPAWMRVAAEFNPLRTSWRPSGRCSRASSSPSRCCRGVVGGGDGGGRAARRHPRDAAQRRLNQRRPWTVCAP